jgi:hypothetical protein
MQQAKAEYAKDDGIIGQSTQVSARELNTRTRLEILLKRDGASFVGKLEEGIHVPRPVLGRMRAAPGIVIVDSVGEITSQSCVITRWRFTVLQHVDSPLRCPLHATD